MYFGQFRFKLPFLLKSIPSFAPPNQALTLTITNSALYLKQGKCIYLHTKNYIHARMNLTSWFITKYKLVFILSFRNEIWIMKNY